MGSGQWRARKTDRLGAIVEWPLPSCRRVSSGSCRVMHARPMTWLTGRRWETQSQRLSVFLLPVTVGAFAARALALHGGLHQAVDSDSVSYRGIGLPGS
jgi:hypothetical protein